MILYYKNNCMILYTERSLMSLLVIILLQFDVRIAAAHLSTLKRCGLRSCVAMMLHFTVTLKHIFLWLGV
jgi:hypothetical protein